jgi:hypothetical protein
LSPANRLRFETPGLEGFYDYRQRALDLIRDAAYAKDFESVTVPSTSTSGVESKKIRPLDLLDWVLAKDSLRPLPRWCNQAVDEHSIRKQPKPKLTETNAVRREELLGAALYCIDRYYDLCSKDGRIVAKDVAGQIQLRYEEIWPERGFVMFEESWAAQLISKHFRREKKKKSKQHSDQSD